RLSRQTITFLILAVVVIVSFGGQLMESPQIRIKESIICYAYYEDTDRSKISVGRDVIGPGAIGGVAELWCKADAVQGQLAILQGYQEFFDGVPSILLAIPFGWAADKYGRKPILSLALVGVVLRTIWLQLVLWYWQAFDVRYTWLSTIGLVVGGGSGVLTTLLFTIVADITPQAERAAIFLRAGALNLLAALAMPPLAAWLMTFNPWIPSLTGTVLGLIAVSVCILIPETLDYHQQVENPCQPEHLSNVMEGAIPQDTNNMSQSVLATATHRWLAKINDSLAFLTKDWRVGALILCFLCHGFVSAAIQLLLQYVSKRYGLTFSKTTLILMISNGFRTLLLLVILPFASAHTMRVFSLSSQEKDLYFTRASQMLLIVGMACIGFSPNLSTVAVSSVITALGQGTYLLLRSFLTTLVEAHHIARVYSIIGIMDTAGLMLASALLAGFFKIGVALGGLWIALPYFFVAAVSSLFLVLMCAVKL
ncbi:hypothetical protein M433DRAFT_33285, partial [Acidomyces richmondensis BFW]